MTSFYLLVGFPDVGVGLGQADVGEDAVDELAGHFRGVDGFVVEAGDDGEDGGSCVGGEGHVAQVDFVEGGFADAEDERAALFEAYVGGTLDEVLGESVGDAGEGAHAAGQDDHSAGGIAAAGDGCADVVFCVLGDFRGGVAEEFFGEVVAAAEAQFFCEDAEGAFCGDEVDAGDAGVGIEKPQEGLSEDGAAGSGESQGEVEAGLVLRDLPCLG